MADTTTPAPKKGSGMASKIVLLLVVAGGGGYVGKTQCDNKTRDQSSLLAHSIGGFVDNLATAADKDPADVGAIDAARSGLSDIVQKNGGLVGPPFAVSPENRQAAGATKLNAASLVGVASLLAGKVDQAEADFKDLEQDRAELQGVADASEGFNAAVVDAKKLLAELKKPGVDQKPLLAAFRKSFARGAR